MRQECRERFPLHRLQKKPLVSDPAIQYGTCGENVPDIPGACATRNFAYLVRHPRVMCFQPRHYSMDVEKDAGWVGQRTEHIEARLPASHLTGLPPLDQLTAEDLPTIRRNVRNKLWRHDMGMLAALLALCEGNHVGPLWGESTGYRLPVDYPHKWTSHAESVPMACLLAFAKRWYFAADVMSVSLPLLHRQLIFPTIFIFTDERGPRRVSSSST